MLRGEAPRNLSMLMQPSASMVSALFCSYSGRLPTTPKLANKCFSSTDCAQHVREADQHEHHNETDC